MDKPDFNIIQETANKINCRTINVYNDIDVDWCEVTLLDIDLIKKLLWLIDYDLLDDVGESICFSIDNEYDINDPYSSSDITSPYYDFTNTLPPLCDWDYNEDIKNAIRYIKAKRAKADEYEEKLKNKETQQKNISAVSQVDINGKPFVWSDDVLFKHNEYRVTPVPDFQCDKYGIVHIYYNEVDMCFYTPDVGKAFLRERSAYELLTTTSDNVAHVFTALINARIWNDEKFSFKRIVAEWNYFVFVLSCIRMFPGITNRLGKPSKEEQYIVEKNVNFWEGDYKDNEFMKAGYIGFASNDENEVVKDLKAYIKELEILNDGQAGEIEILTGENSELKEQLKDAETLQTNAQEKSERGAKLTTTQILHLVRHAQLDINKSSAQEWAAALHLISGCSENTLRQQFYNPTLSDGSKSKVETLYSQKLEELKAKNK